MLKNNNENVWKSLKAKPGTCIFPNAYSNTPKSPFTLFIFVYSLQLPLIEWETTQGLYMFLFECRKKIYTIRNFALTRILSSNWKHKEIC